VNTPRALTDDTSGLPSCPRCGSLQVRMQTPPDDDGIVRRAYLRCFACRLTSPPMPGWEPVPLKEVGRVSYAPFRDYANEWARGFTNE
jgi:hypothetical protein